jgi:hypothetical protein
MRRMLPAVCIGLSLLVACGGGGTADQADRTTSEATAKAPELDATPPADVKAAAEGKVNRPTEGRYLYTLSSSTTNAATPDSPARTSSPDAEFQSTITYDGDVVITQDRIKDSSGVATVKRRWTDDAIEELSFETKTDRGSGGCTFDEPAVVLSIPVKTGKLPAVTFEGEGTNCNGSRKISVERQEDAIDASGSAWPTWRIRAETVVKSTGLTNKSTNTQWFSPDLGKEVRATSVSEYINPSGGVAARAESEILLKTYPGAD